MPADVLELPCRPWPGPFYSNGYGRASTAGRPAHVLAWIAATGEEPPAGHVLDHECHNLDGHCGGGKTCPHRACTEVEHLVIRTIGENARRGWRTRIACQRGHPWTEANTYWRRNGRRMCRRCIRLRDNSRYATNERHRETVKARSRRNHHARKTP